MADVSISIGVVLSELKAGLEQGSKHFDDFTKQSKKAREGVMFFSNAIRDIAGAASPAGTALSGLLAGFAMGGPMGLALGGVQALIAAIKETGKAEAEAAREAKRAQEERRKEYEKTRIELERLRFTNAGGNADVFDAAQSNAAAQAEVRRAQSAVDAARSAFERAKSVIPAARRLTDDEAARYYGDLRALLDKVKAAQAELQAAQRNASNVAEVGGRTASASVGREEEAARRETEAQERAVEAARLQAAKEADARVKARIEANERIAVEEANLRAEIDRFAEEAAQRDIQRANEKFQREYEIEQAYLEQVAEARRKQQEDAERALAEMSARVESAIQPITSGVQSMFSAAANGAEDMGEATRNVLRQMLSAYTSMMVQWMSRQVAAHVAGSAMKKVEVAENAAVAASGAASSQASIPFVGPVLAIAAMGAMLLAVMGLQSLFSASGGFDIGNFSPLTQLHPNEMVLPANLAERVRNMTDQQAPPTSLTFTITAMDAKGVEDALRDNKSAISRVLREMQRDGRI